MASRTMKQICAKCNKGAGGIAMCNGCEQSFCVKHFVEHRQELSQGMDSVVQEYDLLKQNMNYEGNADYFFKEIDRWEEETIEKIRLHARKTRLDLRQSIEQKKDHLKISVDKLTEELQMSCESDDYTEFEIKRWTEQIKSLRQIIENSSNIHIEYDRNPMSIIGLIKVQLIEQSLVPMDINNGQNIEQSLERFVEIYGNIKISTDGLTSYYAGNSWCESYVSGANRYLNGIHHIHFRIEQKFSKYLFFGIITDTEKLTSNISTMRSISGWWDLNYSIINGIGKCENIEKNLQTGDTLTLILNCDQHFIQMKHNRTNRLVGMPIDVQQCPFPWRIVIRLDSSNDCVTIVH